MELISTECQGCVDTIHVFAKIDILSYCLLNKSNRKMIVMVGVEMMMIFMNNTDSALTFHPVMATALYRY